MLGVCDPVRPEMVMIEPATMFVNSRLSVSASNTTVITFADPCRDDVSCILAYFIRPSEADVRT